MRTINLFVKRIFDIFLSCLGLLILSPLFLIVSILIKLSSKGSVFFTQERLGKNGKVFKIIKFRTMVMNAESIGDGLFVSSGSDSRITKIGKLLRATSLDELPQLFNVVAGTMSLVGPRPPVTYFPYKEYENYPITAKKRFEMRPGITGLAQIRTRTKASWNERIAIDVEYIENFSIMLDAKILLGTFTSVLFKKDIYPEDIEKLKNNRPAVK